MPEKLILKMIKAIRTGTDKLRYSRPFKLTTQFCNMIFATFGETNIREGQTTAGITETDSHSLFLQPGKNLAGQIRGKNWPDYNRGRIELNIYHV